MNTELLKLSKALVAKMIDIEKDPDLISIFSIARSRGYVISSQLWHKELKEIADLIKTIDSGNSVK